MTTPPWASNPEGHPIMQYVYELETELRYYKAQARKAVGISLTWAIVCMLTGGFWGYVIKWWIDRAK